MAEANIINKLHRTLSTFTDRNGFSFTTLYPGSPGESNEDSDRIANEARLVYDYAIFREMERYSSARRKEIEETVTGLLPDKLKNASIGVATVLLKTPVGNFTVKKTNPSKRLDESLLRQQMLEAGVKVNVINKIIENSKKESAPPKTFDAALEI